ncbi:MAG TPA: nitronate monooxygenase [bacterium]
MSAEPLLIQGGMGIGVSGWRLARAISVMGQLGVVSGTALDAVFVRRLQLGDPDGHLRRVLRKFPVPSVVDRILAKYFREGGKGEQETYRLGPMYTVGSSEIQQDLSVAANFAEVALSKERHDGLVGLNLLEKVQMPTLASLFGSILAGVDYVLMGAGIPREIPGALDRMSAWESATLRVHVAGAGAEEGLTIRFDPSRFAGGGGHALKRPKFLAIVSSHVLAANLLKKSTGRVDGFVVEGPTAGGHNAPPRGAMQLNTRGEPIYGERDEVDLEKMRALGTPFWLAGGYGSADGLGRALKEGANGIQAGTAFAFCEESGFAPELKRDVLRLVWEGRTEVRTDPLASSSGYPFKVLKVPQTLSEIPVYEARERVCDLGFLREVYQTPAGGWGYRCPAEPVDVYLRKGGMRKDTEGRQCLCNSLMAAIGLAQRREGGNPEPALITAGDDITSVRRFLSDERRTYTAADVVRDILRDHPGTFRDEEFPTGASPR